MLGHVGYDGTQGLVETIFEVRGQRFLGEQRGGVVFDHAAFVAAVSMDQLTFFVTDLKLVGRGDPISSGNRRFSPIIRYAFTTMQQEDGR